MSRHRVLMRLALFAAALGIASWAGDVGLAQTKEKPQTDTSRTVTITDSAGRKHTRTKRITQAEREAAADRLKAKAAAAGTKATAGAEMAIAGETLAIAAAALPTAIPRSALQFAPNGELVPDYSGVTPNYANSPMPVVDPVLGISGGIRKFVDTLPGLNAPNNLGNAIPVAVADTTTYPGSDYYEIELGEYEQKMHSDLPPTRLRGYRQTNVPGGVPPKFQYLGPLIVAQKDRPVRIKFTNNLPTGAAGNLFIPVDSTIMGAGTGPRTTPGDVPVQCKKGTDGLIPPDCFTENRATVHLHGGVTPWISDGTTHQWITPAGETTFYPEGVSVYNVPDMPNPGKPGSATNPSGSGTQTFYYTNKQSARLMFYHDHAHGITRLNVYAGEAAGYLLQDKVELDLIAKGVIPADQIPLVIQDKTFVDAATIFEQDPTWNWGTGAKDPITGLRPANTGDLWWPHVYMPAQNPYDISGANAMGRWHYGPWFWPPTVIPFNPVPNPYYDCNAYGLADLTHPCTRPWQPQENPAAPNPSWGAEAFLDTPVVNGTAYPSVTVKPKPYRFRILNAAHDRFWNLQLYVAASKNSPTTAGTTGALLCDGKAGAPTDPKECTEVKMVPAMPGGTGFPELWPKDGREGGVPDPDPLVGAMGPDFIQIGTEGGFLPMPVVVPNQPITWNLNPTTFNFGNVENHALLIAPAERADVIVDFSAFAGKTLILYNDAPAAFPALDPRNDYYTGAPDLRDTGGVGGTLPGYGPNIRTIMQIVVEPGTGTSFDLPKLMTEWAPKPTADPAVFLPGVFQSGQDPIIVGQSAYDEAYATAFPTTYPLWGAARIQDSAMSFMTTAGAPVTFTLEPKAIHDEMGATFDDYGRMSAKLGLELPKSTAQVQNFVMQGYNDPPTELIKLSGAAVPIGTPLEDGTQLWKVTHNGVDTHPIHFHLFHVQLINRVGWDGAIRLPDATELGWKDTVRFSPLEDTIVALRPIAPTLEDLPPAWGGLPNSIRPLNPALPLTSTFGFTNLDPGGNNVTVSNELTNFGWEYVWHCHILSHEENDMMRGVVFAVPPPVPTLLTATIVGTGATRRVDLTWADGSPLVDDGSGYTLQRANDPGFTTALVTTPIGNVQAFSDVIGAAGRTLYYRLAASNTVGSGNFGFPTISADSTFSNVLSIVAPGPPGAPTNLTATYQAPAPPAQLGPQVFLTFVDNAANETSFTLQRATNTAFTAGLTTFTLAADQTTFTDNTIGFGRTYFYRVRAVSSAGGQTFNSAFSNTATVVIPQNPTGLVLALGFNETNGTALDGSFNLNHGTLINATRVPIGQFGGAVSFNGISSIVNVAHHATLNLTTGMTLEAWVNPTANAGTGGASGWRTIIMKERTTTGLSYALYGNDGNANPSRPAGYARIAFIDQPIAAPPELPLNNWTHIAVTYGGGFMRLYVNGTLRLERAQTGTIVTSTNPLRIGGNNVFASEFFAGMIDEVRVYRRALTQPEIAADMFTPIP